MATMNQDTRRLVEALLDDEGLSLDDLCRVASVTPDWVAERVRTGLLGGFEPDAAAWRFDVVAVQRVRWMLRVERDFDAVPELAALVADLQHEIARLRARLRRAGID
jgi:chaperone modulatory protein CbpM